MKKEFLKGVARLLVATVAVMAATEGFAQGAGSSLSNKHRKSGGHTHRNGGSPFSRAAAANPSDAAQAGAASHSPASAQSAAASRSPGAAAARLANAGLTKVGGPSDDEKREMTAAPALNWTGAEVDLVLEAYAEAKGRTLLKDPGVPAAKITLKSKEGQELTKEEYLEAIEVVLEMNQIHVEDYGERFIRALPRAKVRKDGIPILNPDDMEREKMPESGRVVSMLIPFKFISTEEAQKALEGFKSDSGILLVFERTNSILVTDTLLNINRMVQIAKMIDKETPVLENVFVRQIKYAAAEDIKTALETIVQESQKEQEKNGKQVNNQAQRSQPNFPGLRRSGQQNNPPQSVNNASLVMSVSDADRGMIRGKVLILADERSNKLIVVTQKTNMDFFDRVIESLDVETTPDTLVKVYRLKYADAEEVSDMINDLIGNASSSKSTSKNNTNANAKKGAGSNLTRGSAQAAKKPANQRTGDAKAGELSKENTTVLADKRINGLIVMTEKELVPTVEQIIESMDVKLSQVLIETCIIEVTLGDELNHGIDWVQNGRYQENGTWTTQTKKDQYGRTYYYYVNPEDSSDVKAFAEGTETEGWTQIGDALTEGVWTAGALTKDGYFTGNPAYAAAMGGGSGGGQEAASIVAGTATNLFGNAFNYIFKSDKLNLTAIIKATKTDKRAKYLASPIVMTVDNKEATIEATENRKFLSNYQSSSSSSYYGSSVVPQYESKDVGIKIKVKPKINPNGTVMLNVEEEYSQVGSGQSILNPNNQYQDIDTMLTRKMSADTLLENMQTVILCGLTETQVSESETGIPILKDIPWIGKWLFSKVSQSEGRKELLIFMTPYVLDEGEAAQVEALRRKKALSDPHPWEDHGWSLSELADPVSKREQLRRLKDEWRKQDEERKTKLAIEKAKVERTKELEKMSKEEREFWLEQHKEELKEEEQEELEKKMLDDKSQEELRKLAAEIREKKLKEAKEAIDKADAEERQENERGKLEREKAEKKAEAEKNAEVAPAEAEKKAEVAPAEAEKE